MVKTCNGGLAHLARAPALQAGGNRFDSDILHLSRSGFEFWIWFLNVLKNRLSRKAAKGSNLINHISCNTRLVASSRKGYWLQEKVL